MPARLEGRRDAATLTVAALVVLVAGLHAVSTSAEGRVETTVEAPRTDVSSPCRHASRTTRLVACAAVMIATAYHVYLALYEASVVAVLRAGYKPLLHRSAVPGVTGPAWGPEMTIAGAAVSDETPRCSTVAGPFGR
ncbi:MAG: hypothetical protein ABIM89_15270 [Mycobacteriales bacterium]